MSETEAKDAFIIFDEAYEGNDVDAFYLGKWQLGVLKNTGLYIKKKTFKNSVSNAELQYRRGRVGRDTQP